MHRRTFIGTAVGSVVAVPTLGLAQSPDRPVVGFLSSRAAHESAAHVEAFRRGLAETGYVEGRDLAIDYRWADGHYERLPGLATDLVARRVVLLVAAGGAPSALAAKRATGSIPIVFVIGDDPVKIGVAQSFNRPGGNTTGVSFLTNDLGGKRLELLCELVPNASTVGLLLNPKDPGAEAMRRDVDAVARLLKRRFVVLHANTEAELEPVFNALAPQRIDALVVQNDPFFDSQRDRLIALASRRAVPAIYHIREFPAAGGLMSYGASLVEAYRQLGTYAGRILKGEKAAEMPISRPTKFELVINAKTARALNIAVPQLLLLRADEVIS
jgi:putative ABC transport system substrate-binding protein